MQFVGIEIATGGTHGVVLDLDSARVIAETSVAGCKEFAFCGRPLKEPLSRTRGREKGGYEKAPPFAGGAECPYFRESALAISSSDGGAIGRLRSQVSYC